VFYADCEGRTWRGKERIVREVRVVVGSLCSRSIVQLIPHHLHQSIFWVLKELLKELNELRTCLDRVVGVKVYARGGSEC